MNILGTIEGSVVLAAPLILAAMGGWASERSGVINIALEGKMLIGTVTTVLVAAASGNPIVGVLAGIACAIALSLSHWALTQKYQIDHIVSGMAINAIAFGLADTLYKRFLNPDMSGFPRLPLPLYWGLALVLPFAIWLYGTRTRGGLHLLAVGEEPSKSRQMGLAPVKVRFTALIFAGICCGLAGALLVTNAGSYENNMTAGKGFIALAALIVGGWKPLPTLAACLAIGFLQQMRITLQGVPVLGVQIPGWFWISLPYIVTVIALAGFLGRNRTPAGLGRP
jgi:general nucleoside transport system permease protein